MPISANPTMPIFGQESISAVVGGYFNDRRFLSFNPVWLIEQGTGNIQRFENFA